MTSVLTRRGLLSATPVAIVAASAPALAAAECSDAALLALRAPLEDTRQAYEAALAAQSEAEARSWSPRRAGPNADLAAALTLVERTCRANREIVERMCEIPARTIEGLAFKAKVSLDHEDNRMEELVTSIMDDILAVGGAHA